MNLDCYNSDRNKETKKYGGFPIFNFKLLTVDIFQKMLSE